MVILYLNTAVIVEGGGGGGGGEGDFSLTLPKIKLIRLAALS